MISQGKYAAFQENGVKYLKKMRMYFGRHLVSEMEKQTESTNCNSLQQILTLYL